MTPTSDANARTRRELVRRDRVRRLLTITLPPEPIEEPGPEFPALLDALKPRTT